VTLTSAPDGRTDSHRGRWIKMAVRSPAHSGTLAQVDRIPDRPNELRPSFATTSIACSLDVACVEAGSSRRHAVGIRSEVGSALTGPSISARLWFSIVMRRQDPPGRVHVVLGSRDRPGG
jgi:hypothetical protein